MHPTLMEKANQLVTRSPFNRWLGMSCTGADEDRILLTIKWREELISSPELRSTHGGVLAALVDCAADYAIALKVGHPVPTMDLRVDYHRTAKPGDLQAEGKVIHLGRRFGTAEARVFDMEGKLVASGRGLYLIQAPEPAPTMALDVST
jgi:uncharacterized protein (TIGR00369 family)